MAFEFNGTIFETNDNGHLLNHEDWSEDMARATAAADGLELTERHRDLVNFGCVKAAWHGTANRFPPHRGVGTRAEAETFRPGYTGGSTNPGSAAAFGCRKAN